MKETIKNRKTTQKNMKHTIYHQLYSKQVVGRKKEIGLKTKTSRGPQTGYINLTISILRDLAIIIVISSNFSLTRFRCVPQGNVVI